MEITVEECKPDSYVGCPMPKVDLPECEYGWDLGNGTAVCATEQPPSAPLAATGADMGLAVGCWLLAGALICVGLALVARSKRREKEQPEPTISWEEDEDGPRP